MSTALCSRHLVKLSFLGPTSSGHVARYLELLEARHYAPNTLISITDAIRRFTINLPEARRALVTQHLAQATAHDVDLFVAAVSRKGLSPSTINTTLSLIKEFFDYLREEGETHIQPVIRRRHRVFAPSNLPKPMAEADLVAFFKAIDSIRDRALFLLMLRGGLRVSEVSTLTWDDVDFEAGTLRIKDSKGQVDRIGFLAPDATKSLKLWHTRRASQTSLFPGQETRRTQAAVTLSTRHIYRLMIMYLRQAGVTAHYSPHCLRHTFATQLLNAGVTLEVLKELMGHRSIQMTLCYAELYDSTKRQQYDAAMERIEQRQAVVGR